MSRIVRDSRLTYDRFRVLIEQAPHGAVHAGIGGPGGDMTTMISPNDPIFWMHHSFIDKLWADHQKYRPRNDYNGRMHGRRASLRDIVHPFNMSVEESLDITSLCYSFQPFSRTRTSASRDITLTPMKRNTTNLIVPQPLPDHWIQAHGFNETEIRENEAYLKKLMEEVNAPIMNENRQLILEDMDVPFQQNEEETDTKALTKAISVAVGSAQISIVIASLFLISVI